MVSYRIKTIASLIDKNDIVLDVGTDHAYLPIYLIKEKLCKKVYASDISEKVLEIAKNNLIKNKMEKDIKLYLSNGLDEIDVNYDMLVVAGMGYYTIKKIIKDTIECKKIIVQTNSDHDKLRKYMMKIGYKIDKELTIEDKGKYYVLIRYIKGKESLSKHEILFGKSENINYYQFLVNKYFKIYDKLPFLKKVKYNGYIKYLNKKIFLLRRNLND